MDEPRILLTNDDGIDSPGFRAVYDRLTDVGEVIAVAPIDDRSAVGRALSTNVTVREHELGYGIEGTPADCVIAGLESLCPDVDLVVSGCNKGANLGAYVLGRSGTVSAAVEAAFFDVPSIAVSLYVPEPSEGDWQELASSVADYRIAADAAGFLADNAVEAGVFEQADYLNVNAPWPNGATGPTRMRTARPSTMYEMGASRDGDRIELYDRIWERMATGDVPDPPDTDRSIVIDGDVAVSPLTAPHTTEHHEALDGLAAAYETE